MKHIKSVLACLPLVAKALGRRMDVEVRIGPYRTETDGRVIFLPSLPLEDPDVEVLMMGRLKHEGAHLRYTDWVPNELFKSKLHEGLTGIFEDVRIEGLLFTDYPGWRAQFEAMVGVFVRGGKIFAYPNEDAHPAKKLQGYLLYRLRCDVLGQTALSGYADIAEAQVEALLPVGAMVRIRSVVGRVSSCVSEYECLDLASEVLDIIEEELSEPPQNRPEESKAPDESPGADVKQDTAAAKREDLKKEILGAKEGDLLKDFADELAEQLNDKAAQAATRDGGGVGVGQAAAPPQIGDPSVILADARAATTALRTRLHRYLVAESPCRTRYSRRGKRFAKGRILSAMTGDPRICERRQRASTVDTDVVILLDDSGSMAEESRIEIARTAVLSCVSSLESIRGVNVAAAAFPGYQADVTLLTGFDERVMRTANRYPMLSGSGGTPLLPALMWALNELAAQNGTRKLLILVTDGMPSALARCQKVIGHALNGGFEVIGVGIKVPTIDHLVPGGVCIDGLTELAPALFQQLTQRLRKAA